MSTNCGDNIEKSFKNFFQAESIHTTPVLPREASCHKLKDKVGDNSFASSYIKMPDIMLTCHLMKTPTLCL